MNFNTVVGAATSLYSNYIDIDFYRSLVSYYPSVIFNCSGNITKILFVTTTYTGNCDAPSLKRIHGPRFGAQSTSELDLLFNSDRLWDVLVNKDRLRARVGPGVQDSDVDVNELNKTDRYCLYELILNDRSKIPFRLSDVLVIYLPRLISRNPLHQDGGGWNEYIDAFGNSETDTYLPLVAIEAGEYLESDDCYD